MINFYEKIIDDLKYNKRTWDDVVWVGTTSGYKFDKEAFLDKALATNYESGFGTAEVVEDLVIVGRDFWMTRSEYDGSEWWDFHDLSIMREPSKLARIDKLAYVDWGATNIHEIKQANKTAGELKGND